MGSPYKWSIKLLSQHMELIGVILCIVIYYASGCDVCGKLNWMNEWKWSHQVRGQDHKLIDHKIKQYQKFGRVKSKSKS